MGWEGRKEQWAVLEPEETLGHKQTAHTLFFLLETTAFPGQERVGDKPKPPEGCWVNGW